MPKPIDETEYFIPGGPWHSGLTNSRFGQPWNPHYFINEAHNSVRVEFEKLTKKEVQAYAAGYAAGFQYNRNLFYASIPGIPKK